MTHSAILFLTAALLLVPAQTGAPATPAEEAPAAPVTATEEAPQPVPAGPAAEALDLDTERAAQDALVPALVSLDIEVLEEQEALYEQRTGLERLFDGFVQQRVPLRVVGMRVSPEGLVLIRDPNLPLRRYAKVTAADTTGRVMALRVAAVLENHAAVLLEPVEPVEGPLPCVEFVEADLAAGDPFLTADPTYLEDTLALKVEPAWGAEIIIPGQEAINHMLWWLSGDAADEIGHYVPLSSVIIMDRLARPIGVALDSALWQTETGTDSWIGRSIMADRRISPKELQETTDRILQEAGSSIREVAIHFREDSSIARKLDMQNDTAYAYGVLLDASGRVFIPTDMDRNAVRQVEKFTVKNGEQVIDAEFDGLFKDFGGIMLHAKGLEGDPATIEMVPSYPRGRMFHSLTVRRRYGARYDEAEYNRYLDMATGYRDARYPVPRKPMRTGDLAVDEQGRLFGFCAPIRRDDKDEILAGQAGRAQNDNANVRLYYFADVQDHLKSPQEHFDAAARPMSRKEELGTAWLGVEYQQMTPPLARAQKVESATRGGSRGLLVTHVYENSPAGRRNIEVGDILLSLRAAGIAGEIDLTLPEEFAATEARIRDRVLARLWRPRINYLVLLLTRLGAGREVSVNLLHDGAERTITLTLEMSPENFDTTQQFADASLDMTVRNMTYEVRDVLKLAPDAPGVVVSDVTSGGKADMAQIQPYEIITQIGDAPVKSVEDFENLVRSAQAVGRLNLTVMRLGLTRLVEIDLLPS
jgi:hypothetical protein